MILNLTNVQNLILRRARESKNGDGWREERPKREIFTTELVAGADFFHHLPCRGGRKTTSGGLGERQS